MDDMGNDYNEEATGKVYLTVGESSDPVVVKEMSATNDDITVGPNEWSISKIYSMEVQDAYGDTYGYGTPEEVFFEHCPRRV